MSRPADDIGAIADEIMAHSGGPDARVGKFARLYPDFAQGYPKLFDMCCAATTHASAQTVKCILAGMLSRLRDMDSGRDDCESATQQVHESLKARFVDPLVAAADALDAPPTST